MPIRFAAQPGLVAYLTVGDPDLRTTRGIALAAIDAGADVIELGVPFSDPLADGPVIQRASERSLRHGTTLADVLAVAAELRSARPQAGLVIFSYFNPILRYGLERFCAAAEQAGVDGVLVTDMIVEEAALIVTISRLSSSLPRPVRMSVWSGSLRLRGDLSTPFHGQASRERSSLWLLTPRGLFRACADIPICPLQWDSAFPTPSTSPQWANSPTRP
jgi:hypothetical protein